jgi:hypothetical protein
MTSLAGLINIVLHLFRDSTTAGCTCCAALTAGLHSWGRLAALLELLSGAALREASGSRPACRSKGGEGNPYAWCQQGVACLGKRCCNGTNTVCRPRFLHAEAVCLLHQQAIARAQANATGMSKGPAAGRSLGGDDTKGDDCGPHNSGALGIAASAEAHAAVGGAVLR